MSADNNELVTWAIRELVSRRVLVQHASSERFRADGVVRGTSLRVESVDVAMKWFEARAIRRTPSDLALDVGIGSFYRSATQFSVGDPELRTQLCAEGARRAARPKQRSSSMMLWYERRCSRSRTVETS